MAVTPATFRENFPEFASVVAYTPSQVTFWLDVADKLLSTTRWGRMRDLGLQLFAAHMMVLERQAQVAASAGKPPGINTGPVNNKSVGPASIGFDSQAAIGDGAGHWNLTIYGTRLWSLIQMFGAAPMQVGIGIGPAGFFGAWPGPWPFPIPGGSGFTS